MDQKIQEQIEYNVSQIKKLRRLVISCIVLLLGGLFTLVPAFDSDGGILWVLVFIAWLSAAFISAYCAKLVGFELIDTSNLQIDNEGCILVNFIVFSVYFCVAIGVAFVGWAFAIKAIFELKKENNQLIERNKK